MKNMLFVFFTLVTLGSCAQQPDKLVAIPHPLFWENKPLSYKIVNNDLTIVAGEKTDMFRDPNVTYNTDNAPKLLFQADEDFVLSAAIEHSFASKWDGGAIIIKSDSLNWVKFCFEKDYTGVRRVVSVVTKNISDDSNSVEIDSNKVFQFEAKPGFKVGFLAQSPTGTKCEVNFTQIKYEKRKIKDPYTGE